jgi:type II secretory pathway pseudopilin PulG
MEMILVVAIMMVMTAVTVLTLQPTIKNARAESSFQDVLMQLKLARQWAIAQRTQYIVCFGLNSAPQGAQTTPFGAPTAQTVQIYNWISGTALSAAVQVRSVPLAFDMQFQTLSGFPTSASTVPDGFGNGATAMNLDIGVAGAINNQVVFWPDGSAHDTNGNLNSGIIYVARTVLVNGTQVGDMNNSRAITLYGATGRVRGWRLDGAAGSYKWVEQQ